MKRFAYIFILIFIYTFSFSQNYSNNWIEYDQHYFKIKVSKEGIYRISYAELANILYDCGEEPAIFNPQRFQIFTRGEEQYILVNNTGGSFLNNGDYIEFYATKNDGWLDSLVYETPSSQANPNFSLFTDTAVYFLTWNTSTTGNKRMAVETDINFNSYSPLQYFYKISRSDYTSQYYLGETNSNDATRPEYTAGEGWFGSAFYLGGYINYSISTTNKYSGGPNTNVEFVVVGASDYGSSTPDHHLMVSVSGSNIIDTTYEGYIVNRFTRSVSTSLLGSSTTPLNFTSVNNIGSGADRNAVAYISVKYPHTFDLENASSYKLYIPDGAEAKDRLDITNFNVATGDSAALYDLTNHKRIKVVKDGSTYKALVPDNNAEKECYLTTGSQINNISGNQLITVSSFYNSGYAKFTDYSGGAFNNSDYIIISQTSIMPVAAEYSSYRNNSGYTANVFDVEELYDQFSYGIRKHPLAIRNFMNFAINNYTDTIKDLFIIGKAYRSGNDGGGGQYYGHNSGYFDLTLVPSFGVPPSDILFTSKLTDTSNCYPAISTGRLAARNTDHVTLYLNKVDEYESKYDNPDEEWMKNILHLGGGMTEYEQNSISGYLDNYKSIIEDTLFGGYVRTYLKTSSEPMQMNPSDTLKQIINNGVVLLTFFGHGATIGFDLSLNNASDYSNSGRYPLILANSCFNGDIYNAEVGSSEEFVLIEDKGAIGYLASISKTLPTALNLYSTEFYKNIAYKYYGQPIGKCIQEAIKELDPDIYFNNEISANYIACLLMTLHGDPAIKLYSYSKPDYVITGPDISFSPASVTSEIDSFDVNINARNIGRAIDTSIWVSITRTYPDGTDSMYMKKITAPLYQTEITFILPVDITRGAGINTLRIRLDELNEVFELNENNNEVIITLNIKSSDIIPVYPYKYAVIPNDTTTLKASTSDPFSPAKNYVFEIDTTDEFNSPLKLSQTVNHSGGVVSWKPAMNFTDSTVYYWRVSLDSVYMGKYNWRESSFQYIPGKKGWGQAHFYQFKNDRYQYVSFNRDSLRFDFFNDKKLITAKTGNYYQPPGYDIYLESVYINNSIVGNGGVCLGGNPYQGNGMQFVVIDPVSGVTLMNWRIYPANPSAYDGRYDSYFTHNDIRGYFDFFTNTTACWYAPVNGCVSSIPDTVWKNRIKNFIDSIPDNYYVLVKSHGYHNANTYNDELYKAFKSIGCMDIRDIDNGNPYICFGTKRSGDTTTCDDTRKCHSMEGNAEDLIQLTDSFSTNWTEGFIESELIGPATHWGSLHWRQHSYKGLNTDSIRLSVIGIKINGEYDTIPGLKGLPRDSGDVLDLVNYIDASVYPYMKLIVYMKDDAMHTPPQMDRWQVLFDGVPETALDPSIHYSFYNDTINEGESIKLSIAAHNISDYDMDSLMVHYWIVDNNNISLPGIYKKLRIHPSGDILIDSVNMSSEDLKEMNSLWVELNPIRPSTSFYDQLEQYHFNNIGEISFYVNDDIINPMLDVTFDGVHILDGDIVSGKPEIIMTLDDENRYLLMDSTARDTSLFRIYIKTPSASDYERIYFYENGEEIMRFFPASLPDNKCRIEYDAEFPEDGIYDLKVQATDRSKNESGNIDYHISFEVINKSTITNVLNWPNPFSTATHFVFILTGNEIPTYFKIQIMTITGKIVKEITQDEIGSIHIGRNITEYAWDGKDEYGDQLANGVYLYRIITNINGEKIEKSDRDQVTNKYFVKEFGKMYLIR